MLALGIASLAMLAGVRAYAYDTEGRIEGHTRGANTALLRFDAASRIVETSESAAGRPHWQYGYDDLDRLDSAANLSTGGPLAGLALGWGFDATGNRTRQQRRSAGTTTATAYSIDPATNRLAAIDVSQRNSTGATRRISHPAPGQLYEASLEPISVGPGAILSASQLYRESR